MGADDPSQRRITVIIQYEPLTQVDLEAGVGLEGEGKKGGVDLSEEGSEDGGNQETEAKPEVAAAKPSPSQPVAKH